MGNLMLFPALLSWCVKALIVSALVVLVALMTPDLKF